MRTCQRKFRAVVKVRFCIAETPLLTQVLFFCFRVPMSTMLLVPQSYGTFADIRKQHIHGIYSSHRSPTNLARYRDCCLVLPRIPLSKLYPVSHLHNAVASLMCAASGRHRVQTMRRRSVDQLSTPGRPVVGEVAAFNVVILNCSSHFFWLISFRLFVENESSS